MADQVFFGNFSKGLTNNKTAFNIDNDAFPYLINFFIWRGRAKRKRGTSFLGQLKRQISVVQPPGNPWELPGLVFAADTANLISGFSLEASSSITPASLSLIVNGDTYTEPSPPDGTLLKNGLADPGSSINYATGEVVFAGVAGATLTGTFSYFPGLPVMGLRDFSAEDPSSLYPFLLAFDTKYSYQITSTILPSFYITSYYKNTNITFTWHGADYQQFWTTNYLHALWATNNVPGFHFLTLTTITWVDATHLTVVVNGTAGEPPVIIGDYVWTNEITTNSTVDVTNKLQSVNQQTGIVTNVVEAPAGTFTITIEFADSTIIDPATGDPGRVYLNGIIQLLTNSVGNEDGIKWYDGDPTAGTGIPVGNGLGWVNFAPPLTATTVSLETEITGLWYLVGAKIIVPFKDRLLFFSPWIQRSTGVARQLQDAVIWSWNGTPYYNSLTPANETFDATAYYVDEAGKGGYLYAGISNPIQTVSTNEDVLLVGFGGVDGIKTRFVYTSNDLNPFLFYVINSELPSNSTFSAVNLDQGSIDMGPYGLAITDQQSSQRIDLVIPNEIFKVKKINNGIDRVNSYRDYFNEWIYFSYPVNNIRWNFPTQTLLYNYRDSTWSILYENFTAHGNYIRRLKNTWASISLKFGTWARWREPWNSGLNDALTVQGIAGNPQGYVLLLDDGTSESISGTIEAISDDGNGMTQITSTNHCVLAANPLLNNGDFLYFSNAIGSTYLNDEIGKVIRIVNANNFVVDIEYESFTYLGLGKFTRLSQPLLQTKQYPFYWEQGRQCRLGVQKYLFDLTDDAQVSVNIYLSQDPTNVWNDGPIVPSPSSENNTLVQTRTVFTSPESNNLQQQIGLGQLQMWHRMNTSLIGDSVQLGITLSDDQMKDLNYATSEIVLHAIQLTVSPGPLLC